MSLSRNGFGWLSASLLIMTIGLAPRIASAQVGDFQTDLFGKPAAVDASNALRYEATVVPEEAAPGDEVTLRLTATVAPGWHTFSLTQKGLGGSPTVIEAADHVPLKKLGERLQRESAAGDS